MTETHYYEGLGRRKEATARVRLHTGGAGGNFLVNDKPISEYFSRAVDQVQISRALNVTGTSGRFDITVKVTGGGVTGQAGAVSLGVARALLKADPDYKKVLRGEWPVDARCTSQRTQETRSEAGQKSTAVYQTLIT